MFLEELAPIAKELITNPIAFLGGFATGILQLDLSQDPVKSWLDQQTGSFSSPATSDNTTPKTGPQSISID
jgi:hypothetical protein